MTRLRARRIKSSCVKCDFIAITLNHRQEFPAWATLGLESRGYSFIYFSKSKKLFPSRVFHLGLVSEFLRLRKVLFRLGRLAFPLIRQASSKVR